MKLIHFRNSGRVIEWTEIRATAESPRAVYGYFAACYFWRAPKYLKDHQRYFARHALGFGEGAYSSMWYSIFQEFRPRLCLEIGVYRGKTISLWQLLQQDFEIVDGVIEGCSPLDDTGDSYSKYKSLDYLSDIDKNCKRFGLTRPQIWKQFSQDPNFTNSFQENSLDLIYLDGSHDYSDVEQDIQFAKKVLKKGGVLVLDAAAKYLGFSSYRFAYPGHDGSSLAASEINVEDFELLGTVGHKAIFRKNNK